MSSEAQKLRGCAFLVFAILGGLYLLVFAYPWQSGTSYDTGDGYGDAEVAPPVEKIAPKLAEIDGLVYSNPDQALTLCRKLLTQADATSEEKLGASKRLPKCISAVFQKRWAAQKFEDCQSLAQELAATHGDSAEGKSLAQNWRQVREQWLRKAVHENDFSTANRLFKDIFADPNAQQESGALSDYRQFLERRWKAAVQSGDDDAAEKMFGEAFTVLTGDSLVWLSEQFSEFKAARWKKLRASKESEKAQAQLFEAAPYYGMRLTTVREILYKLGGELPQAMLQQWNTDELMARARTADEQGNPLAAMTFLGVALQSVMSKTTYDNVGNPVTTTLSGEPYQTKARQIREQLDATGLTLARKIAKDGVPGIQPDRAESLYVELANGTETRKKPELWSTVCQELVDLQTARARQEISEGKLVNAQQRLENVIRNTAVMLWEANWKATGADPFNGVPRDVVLNVDKAAAAEKKADRVSLLRTEAASGRYIVPQAHLAQVMWQDIQNRLTEQRMLQIIAGLSNNREYAFRQLRPLFRNERDKPWVQQAETSLKDAIREAAKNKQFSALNELCGFFIAELGPPAGDDPFKEDLRIALKASAAEFATSSPMTRVFILSLLADLLRDDPAGAQARKEAMEKGLEVMRTINSRAMSKPDLVMPSLLKGFSVQAIENATQYHLMVFMDGPEQCFVRLNPYRKGSMIVKDGKYVIAVVVTADEIVPYRSERVLNGETMFAKYYIQRENQNAPQNQNQMNILGREEATGDYTLLRAPDGGAYTVDSKSGMVLPAGKK